MVYQLGLGANHAAFMRGLFESGQMRVRVEVLDMDQNVAVEPVGKVLTGQVDVAAQAAITDSTAITRSASLTILDQAHELNLDTSATFSQAMFMDRMVRIFRGVKSPSWPHWVDVPIFTGPISSMARDGDVVSITATGKESLLMGPASTHRTWPKGSYKTTVLRELLAMFGERFTSIPHQSVKTTKALQVAPDTIPWNYIQSVARSWGAGRIVYDGAGYAKYKAPPGGRAFTFRGGVGGSMLSRPKVSYDIANVRNFIVVTGAAPAGGKPPVQALAHAPASHPFSAANLGRDGRWRYLREDIQDDSITTKVEAQKVADSALARHLASALQVDFSAMVIPHLEPFDVVAVDAGTWNAESTLLEYTIPLTADGQMSIGRRYTVRGAARQRNVARKGARR